MPEHVVHFRLVVPLPGLEVGPRPEEEIQFASADVHLSLIRLPGTEMPLTDNMLLTATSDRAVSDEIRDALVEFISEKEQSPSVGPGAIPEEFGDIVLLTGAEAIWFLAPPENVSLLFADIYQQLAAPAARLTDILRWRFNRPHPANPLREAELSWSLDGEEWFAAPGGAFHAPVLGSTGPVLELQEFQEIYEWWAEEDPVVPVSRQILVEANNQLGDNNRAAVSLAVVPSRSG